MHQHDTPTEAGHRSGNIGFGVGRCQIGPSGLTDPTVGLLIETEFQPRVRATPLPVPKKGLPGANSEYHTHLKTSLYLSYHKIAAQIPLDPRQRGENSRRSALIL
jgi:hypothetical protein